MPSGRSHHIPQLKTISDFYRQLQIGMPQSDEFAIMRIEDQPDSKRAEMPLFRCNFFRVVFFTNSGVAFQLGDQSFDSSTNSIYFSYPGKLESWRTSQKIHGYLVCFTSEFARIGTEGAFLEDQYPFFNFEASSMLRLIDEEKALLTPMMEGMLEEMQSTHTDRHEMIRLQLHQYLVALRRLYSSKSRNMSQAAKNGHRILHEFRKALDRHFEQLASGNMNITPTVSEMANKVNLNPSYLNTTIKNLTGKSASKHIQEKTLLEIKSYLMHTDLQMAEISHKLGFSNVSYFNRFFKQATGTTPSLFKRANTK